jgi:hypothetical protein
LAFVAVIYNLYLQMLQLDITREEFRKSVEVTQAQIAALREQASREELVGIIRTLSESIDSIYNEAVSAPDSVPVLQLRHVIHEGWRLRTASVRGGPYDGYVQNARMGGSIIEALHNRLRSAADGLANFLPLYEVMAGKDSPILKYYRSRFVGLGILLADVGGTSGRTIDFFREAERENAV